MIASDHKLTFTADETQGFTEKFGVDWYLNFMKAPWYGRFFERFIGLVKSQFKTQLWNARLTIDELFTILLEIERILNNRPITHDNPTNLDKCLTPNNLLFGRRIEAYSYRDNSKTETSSQLAYSKHLIAILNHF